MMHPRKKVPAILMAICLVVAAVAGSAPSAGAACNLTACCMANGACSSASAGTCTNVGDVCTCYAFCVSGGVVVRCYCFSSSGGSISVFTRKHPTVDLPTHVALRVTTEETLTLSDVGEILNEAFGWEVNVTEGYTSLGVSDFSIGCDETVPGEPKKIAVGSVTLAQLLDQVESQMGISITANPSTQVLELAP
jgi:hypothetical protein